MTALTVSWGAGKRVGRALMVMIYLGFVVGVAATCALRKQARSDLRKPV